MSTLRKSIVICSSMTSIPASQPVVGETDDEYFLDSQCFHDCSRANKTAFPSLPHADPNPTHQQQLKSSIRAQTRLLGHKTALVRT